MEGTRPANGASRCYGENPQANGRPSCCERCAPANKQLQCCCLGSGARENQGKEELWSSRVPWKPAALSRKLL
ncbi:UNVERIFIED_CONTAM: hypothetical protein K2H54_008765 [Gekko kuhli]